MPPKKSANKKTEKKKAEEAKPEVAVESTSTEKAEDKSAAKPASPEKKAESKPAETEKTEQPAEEKKETEEDAAKSEDKKKTTKRRRKAASFTAKKKATKKKATEGAEGERPAKRQKREPAERKTKGVGFTVEEIEEKWEDWKKIFFVGEDWSLYDNIFKFNWDFSHLENRLFGDKAKEEFEGKRLYFFAATEPQLTKVRKEDEHETVVPIPTITVIVTTGAPPSKVGIKSVQRAMEEVVPMHTMKMDWVPYTPNPYDLEKDQYVPTMFFLNCNQRRGSLRNLKEENVKKFEYCLPYIFFPERKDDEDDNTVVNIVTRHEESKRQVVFDFDWDMDEIDEKVDEVMEAEEFPADFKPTLKQTIQEEVKKAKDAIKEAKKKRQEMIDAIPEEEKKAIREMKLLKFYPLNEEPLIENLKSPFINRYYGKANETL